MKSSPRNGLPKKARAAAAVAAIFALLPPGLMNDAVASQADAFAAIGVLKSTQDSQTGVEFAETNKLHDSDPQSGASADAFAYTFLEESVGPILRAFINEHSSCNADRTICIGATASANCQFQDYLRYDDPQIHDLAKEFPILFPFVFFDHGVTGQLTAQAHALYRVQIVNLATGRIYGGDTNWDGPQVVNEEPRVRLPGDFFVQDPQLLEKTVKYIVRLEVNRKGPGDIQDNITADFRNTAKFVDYYIADSGGNPIPGTDKLKIVGDNGPYKKIDPPAKLQNISTRMQVRTGNDVLIGGFIVAGTEPKKVIVRGLGPSLPVSGALADPTLELHDATSTLAMNDNWKDDQQSEIEGTGIPPGNEKESAIVRTLPANNANYTAVLAGKNNTTGVGLVEIYDIGSLADSRLVNISTRGFVDTGDNVMIGGLILGPTGTSAIKVLVRGLGPSLTGAGVTGALPDPMLELHDSNGATIASNDNWQESQEQEIRDTTIPPTNNLESAILKTIPNGNFTAILKGKGNATGVGLVEIYRLQ